MLTRSESQSEDPSGHRLLMVIEARRNGRMQRIRVDITLDATGE